MNYFEKLYEENSFKTPSSFAKFCVSKIKGKMIELGCGDGRDLKYFKKKGIHCSGIDLAFNNIDVNTIVSNPNANRCPEYVYTRFFWHSINRATQLRVLDWITGTLFIEARTTEDKPIDLFGKHKRYLVNVSRLVRDLKDNGFDIIYLTEGRNLSKFKGEDPHIVRVIAKKIC